MGDHCQRLLKSSAAHVVYKQLVLEDLADEQPAIVRLDAEPLVIDDASARAFLRDYFLVDRETHCLSNGAHRFASQADVAPIDPALQPFIKRLRAYDPAPVQELPLEAYLLSLGLGAADREALLEMGRTVNALTQRASATPQMEKMLFQAIHLGVAYGVLGDVAAALRKKPLGTISMTDRDGHPLTHQPTIADVASRIFVFVVMHDFQRLLDQAVHPAQQQLLPPLIIDSVSVLRDTLLAGKLTILCEPAAVPLDAIALYDLQRNRLVLSQAAFAGLFAEYGIYVTVAQGILHELVHAAQDHQRRPLKVPFAEGEAHFVEIFYDLLRRDPAVLSRYYGRDPIWELSDATNIENQLAAIQQLLGVDIRQVMPIDKTRFRLAALQQAQVLLSAVRAGETTPINIQLIGEMWLEMQVFQEMLEVFSPEQYEAYENFKAQVRAILRGELTSVKLTVDGMIATMEDDGHVAVQVNRRDLELPRDEETFGTMVEQTIAAYRQFPGMARDQPVELAAVLQQTVQYLLYQGVRAGGITPARVRETLGQLLRTVDTGSKAYTIAPGIE